MQLQDIRILFDYIYWARSRVFIFVRLLVGTIHPGTCGPAIIRFKGRSCTCLAASNCGCPLAREIPYAPRKPRRLSFGIRHPRVRWEQIEREVRSYLNSMDEADVLHNIAYTSLGGIRIVSMVEYGRAGNKPFILSPW